MGFWSWISGSSYNDVTPNDTLGPAVSGGDPDGFEVTGDDPEMRSLSLSASPWSGWPTDWSLPATGALGQKFSGLVDTAWACLDLNTSLLSTMPVYKMRDGMTVEPEQWMTNPDPDIYTSWEEFAKQLFWDYQLGEAFVMPFATYSNGWPARFRVLPPWTVNVEMVDGRRVYTIGSQDVSDRILHIRYKSTTTEPRGTGPLEAAGARMVAAGVLAKYVAELAQGGGVPNYVLEVDRQLSKEQADTLLDQWWRARRDRLGQPAVLSGGITAKQLQMNAKDMALLELAQFSDSRIAVILGVPPALVDLAGSSNSMTYSNITSLFDYHDRASLRPKAKMVMAALSSWSLPRGSVVEVNRDEYTRPSFDQRVEAYVKLHAEGILSMQEIRQMERFTGSNASFALTGGENT